MVFFISNLFYSQSCYQKSAEKEFPMKYLLYFVLLEMPDLNVGLTFNKQTHYILDYGGFKWRWRFYLLPMLMVFSFAKNVHFIQKIGILCLFLKNVSPSKRVVCFILNNLHFPMMERIAFYALYKSRLLIIPCKADDFCLFIGLPNEI